MTKQTSINKLKKWLAWIAVGIWAIMLFILSALSGTEAGQMQNKAAGLVEAFLKTLFDYKMSSASELLLYNVTAVGLMICGYAVLAFFIWYALRCFCLRNRHAVILSFVCSAFYSVTDELHQVFVPGRLSRVSDWLIESFGALCALLCILLFRWLWYKYPRILNRETVSYVFFGVLTTVVNIVVYGVFFNTFRAYNLISNAMAILISNAIAWITSVLFAYVVNKLFTFHSKTNTILQAIREFGLFIGARVFSFAVDELGMVLLVDKLAVNGGVAKIAMNVIVMIMNYFFSKFIIFKGNTSQSEKASE